MYDVYANKKDTHKKKYNLGTIQNTAVGEAE